MSYDFLPKQYFVHVGRCFSSHKMYFKEERNLIFTRNYLNISMYVSIYLILDNSKLNRTKNCVIFGKIEFLLTLENTIREDQHLPTCNKYYIAGGNRNKSQLFVPVSEKVIYITKKYDIICLCYNRCNDVFKILH